MATAGKGKKQRSNTSVPCEVFFACTLCDTRCRTVPQLHSHYRTLHKGELNVAKTGLKSKEEDAVAPDDNHSIGDSTEGDAPSAASKLCSPSSSPTGERSPPGSSQGSSPTRGQSIPSKAGAEESESGGPSKKRKLSGDQGVEEKSPKCSNSSSGSSEPNSPTGKRDDSKDSMKPSPGRVRNRDLETETVVTLKRNVPLGMLQGKKNSLMVIFQHADQTKPLPEGSSFKLRNAGGEQTYMVVANVDVNIIETQRRKLGSKKK